MAPWWHEMQEAYEKQQAEQPGAKVTHSGPTPHSIDLIIDVLLEARAYLTKDEQEAAYERVDLATRQLFNVAGALLEIKPLPKVQA